jgi:hypothetical protein
MRKYWEFFATVVITAAVYSLPLWTEWRSSDWEAWGTQASFWRWASTVFERNVPRHLAQRGLVPALAIPVATYLVIYAIGAITLRRASSSKARWFTAILACCIGAGAFLATASDIGHEYEIPLFVTFLCALLLFIALSWANRRSKNEDA